MAVQGIFYLWLMKDLCPRHNQNSQNHKKTGKNREILQKTVFLGNFYTTQTRTRPQNFGIFTLPHTKIPYKNNREVFGTYQGIINE